MALMKLELFAALGEKMRWHQARQGLLAENVANADTPGYRGRDLKAFSIDEHLGSGTVAITATQARHIATLPGQAGGFAARTMNSFEITPEGNGVTLEDEMMKVTTNLMDYQAATTLYQKSMKILRTALGRQG